MRSMQRLDSGFSVTLAAMVTREEDSVFFVRNTLMHCFYRFHLLTLLRSLLFK